MCSVHTAASIAAHVGGEVVGAAERPIAGVQALEEAGPEDVAFIADQANARRWASSRAGAALCSASVAAYATGADGEQRSLIIVPDAEIALIKVLELFKPADPMPDVGVHATAFVHSEARLGAHVRIGPHVSVDRGASIGDDVVLHAGARIYADVAIGEGTVVHANAVVRERCVIGKRVILHQGVSIGADGFGYRPGSRRDPAADAEPSTQHPALLKMPHLGHVIIEDDVEIGANTCVDRGKFRATVIGAGTKIDNLVQIAHNCRIGRCCVIAGMVGLAGSVTVGDWVQIGAQAGIAEHVRIGSGAKIGGQAGVMRDVADRAIVFGAPAFPRREALRQAAALRKLPELIEEMEKSKKQQVKKSTAGGD